MNAPAEDGTLPPVALDPALEITPFALFRRLSDGETPLLVDVRPEPAGLTFRQALAWPGPAWRPPPDRPVVLFDDDGRSARDLARRLRSEGHDVASLFGGLRLYELALDPAVVGDRRYLVGRGINPAGRGINPAGRGR